MERYKLKRPDEYEDKIMREVAEKVHTLEKDDRILEWGAKLFYFDRRKCIQLMNFASKLTIIAVDIKIDDLENLGNTIAEYLFYLYEDNKEITNILEKLFEKHPIVIFDKLVDKSIIASLNRNQSFVLDDGYRLYEYIEDNILHTRKLNKDINKIPVMQKIDGKQEYIFPIDRFEELLKNYYKGNMGLQNQELNVSVIRLFIKGATNY